MEKVVGIRATSSVSDVGNLDTLLESAEGDVSGMMILRRSKMGEERGKLRKAREKLAGARWRGF